jgi:hypothetical protein
MSFSGGRGGQSRLEYRKCERNGKKAAGLLFSPETREMPTATSIGEFVEAQLSPRRDHDLCLRARPERGIPRGTSTFFFRRVLAGQSRATDCEPHCHEAVGKCCQRLKIAARGAQHMSSLDQNMT